MDTGSFNLEASGALGVSAALDENSLAKAEGSAQRSLLRLSAVCYFVAGEISLRRSKLFPGLREVFEARVLVVIGGQRTGYLGTYSHEKWEHDSHALDEIHINIGHGMYTAREAETVAAGIVKTICHELVHLFAKARGIEDTSGRNHRYHNNRFAKLAQQMELQVARSDSSHIGIVTPDLTGTGKQDYCDLISLVAQELRILPRELDSSAPEATTGAGTSVTEGTALATRKYVFASCGCVGEQGRKRTLRMARGWWREGSIGCGICKHIFTESPPPGTKTQQPTKRTG